MTSPDTAGADLVMKSRTWIWLALLLMLCVQLVAGYRLLGPTPKDETVSLDEFSAARAYEMLRQLLADESPHPMGSEANALVRERLVSQLGELGLEVEVLESPEQPGSESLLYNVLARLPNTTSRGRPLVLATHYDSVPAGPGAADAGSCVAALLETARVLQRGGPYKRPVYLLITDGEEFGLLGAKAFTQSHALAKEKPFVLNFEARGTSGASVMFETHRGNLAAAQLLARFLPRPSVTGSSFVSVYRRMPNDTDFTVFQRDGWTGLNFAFIDDAQNYHTAEDNLENLSLRSLQHHGENALALAKAIANDPDVVLGPSSEDAVFFDLLTFYVVAFPQSWALPLALVPLVILLVRYGLYYFQKSTWHVMVRVIAAVALALAGAAAVGAVATSALVAFGLLDFAYSRQIVACYAPVSFLIVWLLAWWLLRDCARHVAWIVYWTLWSVTGIAVTLTIPGFSYFLLLPGIVAAIVALVPIGVTARCVVTAVWSSIILLPLANMLPVAIGPGAAVIFHPVFVLVWLPLLPLFSADEPVGEKSQVAEAAAADTPS